MRLMVSQTVSHSDYLGISFIYFLQFFLNDLIEQPDVQFILEAVFIRDDVIHAGIAVIA